MKLLLKLQLPGLKFTILISIIAQKHHSDIQILAVCRSVRRTNRKVISSYEHACVISNDHLLKNMIFYMPCTYASFIFSSESYN